MGFLAEYQTFGHGLLITSDDIDDQKTEQHSCTMIKCWNVGLHDVPRDTRDTLFWAFPKVLVLGPTPAMTIDRPKNRFRNLTHQEIDD